MYRTLVTDVFFDLDHTLWDFEKNSALTFEQLLVDHSIEVALKDFLKIYVPLNLHYWKLYREEKVSKKELRYQRLKKTFDALEIGVEDHTINSLATDYILHLSNFNYLLPNAVEILNYLKPKYRLHIITNGFQEIQEKKMKTSGILDYFDKIVNSEMAGVKKPNPKIFNLALEQARVLPQRALMIGDNLEADILGAQAVGLHGLHFNAHNEPLHEYCPMIHDLGEIKMYL